MAREEGKRYSNCIFSGYGSQQEVEDYVSRNYQQVPAEVGEIKGSDDYVVYFEDSSGELFAKRPATKADIKEIMATAMSVVTRDRV